MDKVAERGDFVVFAHVDKLADAVLRCSLRGGVMLGLVAARQREPHAEVGRDVHVQVGPRLEASE